MHLRAVVGISSKSGGGAFEAEAEEIGGGWVSDGLFLCLSIGRDKAQAIDSFELSTHCPPRRERKRKENKWK
jgi:hypothetical protein